MRRLEFIAMIQEAGWRDSADAQHYGISVVWEKLFPMEAQLEREINHLQEQINRMITGDL